MKHIVLPNPPKGFPPVPTWMNEHTECLHRIRKDKIGAALYLKRIETDGRTVTLNPLTNLQRWIGSGMRTIFPDPDVFEACMNTDALDGVRCTDIRTVYPDLMFYLPATPKMLVSDTQWITAVQISIYDGSPQTGTLGGRTFHIEYAGDRWISMVLFWSDKTTSSFIMGLWSDLTLSEEINRVANTAIESSHGLPFNTEMRVSVGHAVEVYFNMMLLMQSYPEYCHPYETKHRIDGKTENVKAVRVVLPDKLRRRVRPRDPSDGEATSTPEARGLVLTMKWRRGHWRRQPHTTEWEQESPQKATIQFDDLRKGHLVWIVPVFSKYWIKPEQEGVVTDEISSE